MTNTEAPYYRKVFIIYLGTNILQNKSFHVKFIAEQCKQDICFWRGSWQYVHLLDEISKGTDGKNSMGFYLSFMDFYDEK